jgi:aminomuconate-semialdehyde/2-hydroxymuconate-6-semialdehyde dehydrogenase
MSQLPKIDNFIGGLFAPPINGKYLDNKNPALDQTYSLVADSQAADIDNAVGAAKTAFKWWSKRTREQRSQMLYAIADGIQKHADELARLESIDQGKPFLLARETDINRCITNFKMFASAILHPENEFYESEQMGAMNFVQRYPVGVAGLISPWNLPLYLLTWKIAPAIAAGNTVVCKPSELTSMTAYRFAEILQEVGLYPGVVNIVFGQGPSAGDALTKHKDVKLVSFTGGTATGKKVLLNSVEGFKKVSLELGGKNPAIIFADADLSEAIPTTVRSAFTNQGEICLCNSRVYVERKIYDKFLEQYLGLVSLLRVGDPLNKETNLGPLVSREHQQKVLGYIALAKQEGGKIEIGGNQPSLPAPFDKGYFVNPTVITGLAPDSRTQQEEIFGPVVSITPFDTEAEAIALANNSQYGLSASVWTSDSKRSMRVASALEAGTVWVNAWMLRDLRVPFGGIKASGMGHEGGKYSLEFYSEIRNVCVKL